MKKAVDLWRYISLKGLKPLPKTSVSEWADNYRILSNTSAEPGRWRTSRAPYQKAIMDAFTQVGVRRVAVMSSSQIGKSDLMNNIVGRFAHLDPCTIMMIQPTIDMAIDYSKSRIAPMLRDTPALTDLFYTVKDKDGGQGKQNDGNNTILSKIFPGGRLIMCGANSPAGLASRPVRILLADEVDRFPDSAGGEGDPVDLAAKRMTTFWNRVMGLFSTPTVEGRSRIEKEYLAGTQEEWQHQCPNCGEYHTLRYVDIKADYTEHKDTQGRTTVTVESVQWVCPDCGQSFDERTIKNSKQKYTPMNPEALKNGIRSFYVNSFSSPWISWQEIIREWLEAKGDPTREQVVINTRFGEPYRQRGAFEDEMQFVRRRENYGAELPDGVLLLTAAVDTQDNRLEYEICGWGKGEECWGIMKGVILGIPKYQSTWDALDDILDRKYYLKSGVGLKVARVFVDSGGHYTTSVYTYCENSWRKQRIPIRGSNNGPGVSLLHRLVHSKNRPIPHYELGVDEGKQMVMDGLDIKGPGPGYFHFPLDDDFLKDRGYDQIYFKGIISEQQKAYKKNGVISTRWEPTGGVRNEPLDLRVYNLACMQSIKANWAKLEELVTGRQSQNSEKKTRVKEPSRIKRSARSSRQSNIW